MQMVYCRDSTRKRNALSMLSSMWSHIAERYTITGYTTLTTEKQPASKKRTASEPLQIPLLGKQYTASREAVYRFLGSSMPLLGKRYTASHVAVYRFS